MAETDNNIIVAIPAQDDPVWKFSSEKVPHMTMIYLADLAEDFERVLEFVAHACEGLYRFGLSVDHRGTLGPDEADVVFFEDDWGMKPVKAFRNSLLLNKDIQKAYNAVQQYPEWTPHLTMGYPTDPAKPDDRDYPGIQWVQFDRIAVWNGDYSGPEIELGRDRGMEIGMTDHATAILAHHGVKGMKWGVRRAETRWNKEITNVNTKSRMTLAFHNETVSRINRAVDDVNRSDKYRDVDTSTFHGKLKEDYEKDSHEAIMRAIEDSVRTHYGTSPSGTQRAVYNRKTDQIEIRHVDPAQVQHADISKTLPPDLTVQLHRNTVGLIDSVTVAELKHDDLAGDILEHHGVKGMKWGVRRDGTTSSTTVRTSRLSRPATDVIAKQKPGQFVRTSGGKKQIASEDAIRVAASRQVAKKSTTDALSNKQLQDAVTRMNLESQYSTLLKKQDRRTRGQRFIQTMFGAKASPANQEAAKQVAAALAKKAASGGTA